MDYRKTLDETEGMPKRAPSAPRNQYAVDVSRRLAWARDARQLSQRELAARLGIQAPRLANWENGANMVPPEFVAAILLNLKIDANYLYLGDETQLPKDLHDKLAPRLAG